MDDGGLPSVQDVSKRSEKTPRRSFDRVVQDDQGCHFFLRPFRVRFRSFLIVPIFHHYDCIVLLDETTCCIVQSPALAGANRVRLLRVPSPQE